MRLPAGCLLVLVGPSSAGKSTWAAAHFRPEQIVSSDRLRALVGTGEDDQRAGRDAFEVLDLVLDRRLRRGLLTVVDSLGLDSARRRAYVESARSHGRACHAVVFDVEGKLCRSRNKQRRRPLPAKVLAGQLAAVATVRSALADEGFDGVHEPGPVAVVPDDQLAAPVYARRQREEPMRLDFGLQVSSFTWPGGPGEIATRLAAIARAAEDAGFTSLWLMDHFLQIPQIGREWLDMLDSYTTLAYLAGVTERLRLGVLVTGVTYRNPAHLAKIVATLDVLSQGRAQCGLGAAWYEREHQAYGWDFPPAAERLDLLEDALEVLPLLWGPGAPAYTGRRLAVPEAICYPRPLQERVPLLVGGQGERRTLRLVARHADACNLVGPPEIVRHKLAVLGGHCADAGRDPDDITVTHFSPLLLVAERDAIVDQLAALGRGNETPDDFASRVNAGTLEDHVGRFRALAEVGVQTAIVSLADLDGPGPVEQAAPLIRAFAG